MKIKNCPECGTKLQNAPGIGPFCPNKECDVVDGILGTVEWHSVEVKCPVCNGSGITTSQVFHIVPREIKNADKL